MGMLFHPCGRRYRCSNVQNLFILLKHFQILLLIKHHYNLYFGSKVPGCCFSSICVIAQACLLQQVVVTISRLGVYLCLKMNLCATSCAFIHLEKTFTISKGGDLQLVLIDVMSMLCQVPHIGSTPSVSKLMSSKL